ncbi:tetratricopeptide repeat protein [Brucepastera parasyntrophica]|uniref:tetratricopeptide repeat protein n=1 Tax=Brucepastera parasyntrophica TaxID=2880008 RepID=UPI00210D51E8|nr:tetratricopeptide repeat protein [Brucepastera parasyntrophica]ULQ60166.1 tetratricopeptide repeat protein [Brucepastera parasyntrophica]
MAKAALDYNATGSDLDQQRYYALAESAYLRAIEIEPRYVRALYGLSVLYVFEFDQPERAIPYLELINEIEKRNFDAMFVLGRAYYSIGEYDKSIAMYDRILASTRAEDIRANAETNKSFVLERAYGQN